MSRAFRPDDELRRELLSLFAGEARDEIDTISSGLVSLESGGDDAISSGRFDEMMRAAHSLKGGARAVELEPVDRIAHALENLIKGAANGGGFGGETVDLAYRAIDAIEGLVAAATGGPPTEVNVSALCDELDQAAGGDGGAPVTTDLGVPAAPDPEAEPRADAGDQTETTPMGAPSPGSGVSTEATVRVKVSKLDRLMASVRQLETARVGVEYATDRLTEQAEREDIETREYDRRAGVIRDATAGPLVRLERAAREVAGDVAEARTVPLSLAFDPLSRTVRELGRDLGRKAKLEVSGGEIDVDRSVMEALRPALVHLIRNAIDHGIEPPAVRAAAGKPEEGLIMIRARSVAGGLEVEVADDGAGLDAERIGAKAVEGGLVSREELTSLPYEEVLAFVTRPGFSTRDSAGEISGRGVGLDAVAEGLSSIQGALEISAIRGSGSRFVMRTPLAIAATEVIVTELGGQPVGFPLVETDRIVALDGDQDGAIETASAEVALSSRETVEALAPGFDGNPTYAVVVVSQGRRIAVPVDRLVGVTRLSMMPLPELLPPVDLFRSVAILADGRVLRLVEPRTLVEDLPPPPRLLVVDDSAAWRERGRNWFSEAGWTVETASDGGAAEKMLAGGSFDAVLTDLEMSEMDGIELVRAVRGGGAGRRDLPVVVWSASAGDETGEEALAAGADAFLAKEAGNEAAAAEAIRAAAGPRQDP
ncbi:MAG: hybrid sensor histidine kinase/response regulator [Solirubrobacterales bacterium]